MNYLVAAYMAIWCILFGYIYTLRSRQRNLEKTLETIEKQVGKG